MTDLIVYVCNVVVLLMERINTAISNYCVGALMYVNYIFFLLAKEIS